MEILDWAEGNAEKLVQKYLDVQPNEVFSQNELKNKGDYYIGTESSGDGQTMFIDVCFGDEFEKHDNNLEKNYEYFTRYAEDISDNMNYDVTVMTNSDDQTIMFQFTDWFPEESEEPEEYAKGGFVTLYDDYDKGAGYVIEKENKYWTGKQWSDTKAYAESYKTKELAEQKIKTIKMVSGGKVKEKVFIEYLNKDKGYKMDRKYFNSYQQAERWARDNFDKFDTDYIRYEYGQGGKLKEEDYVWNALGKKLIVNKVTDDEYYLTSFGQSSSSPFSKKKVDGYIKNGEWSLKPKYANGGFTDNEDQKWRVRYSYKDGDEDDTTSVWVYGRNRDEAIENAKDEYWDIEEIISVTKMADGGEINEELYKVVGKKNGQLVDISELPMTKEDSYKFIKEQGVENYYTNVDVIHYRGNKKRHIMVEGGELEDDTFVMLFKGYGFVEKRGSYGSKTFYNKEHNAYIYYDPKYKSLSGYVGGGEGNDEVITYTVEGVLDFFIEHDISESEATPLAKGGKVKNPAPDYPDFVSMQYAKGGYMAKLVPKMAKGGQTNADREIMYNFLKDDLVTLQKSIEENNQEEIDKFFSYWNHHLNSLEPKMGSKRMYNFLKDDLVGLEAATKELPSSKEETDRFFSYWNTHLKSLSDEDLMNIMEYGGMMADGGDLVAEEVEITAEEFVRNLKSKGIKATKRTSKNGVFIYGENNGNGGYKYETYFSFSEVPDVEMLELEEYQFLKSHNKMAKGGTFDEKVNSISKKLVGKPVPAPYRKEYGSRYDKEDAQEAARRIVGNMRKLYGE